MADCAFAAIHASGVWHQFGTRAALAGVNLEVARGVVFGLLGPNGGGKTTLFRLLTTYYAPQQGTIKVLNVSAAKDPHAIRRRIGVVFQSPSLDKKLTVTENLRCQGRLYGYSGRELTSRIDAMLERVGLSDRKRDRVETLSGGLARRAELAKGLLHRPDLLILDEPSTGLDPGARRDLWDYLRQLSDEGITILVTTHLMEEAERCDQVGILDRGKLVALGTPSSLRAEIGGDVVTILPRGDADALADELAGVLGERPAIVDGAIRIEARNAFAVIGSFPESVGAQIDSMTVAKPTLEDVFLRKTGHRFWTETPQ